MVEFIENLRQTLNTTYQITLNCYRFLNFKGSDVLLKSANLPYTYLSDCHSHSSFSPDSSESIDVLCQRAQELGLYAYTLTDHCECHEYLGSSLGFVYAEQSRQAFACMTKKQDELRGKLRFYKGVELGQPMQNLMAAEEVLQRNYDFVLGSVHNIKGYEDFYFLDYHQISDEEIDNILTAYFDEIISMIEWGGFDSLSHLTYPLRYICGEHGIAVDLSRHKDEIETIFSLLIQKGKSMEINTSGLRQKIGTTLPDYPLLKQYYDMGGRLITIGSDAHVAKDLGKGIDTGFELLKQAGFSEFAIYENRTPKLLPIQ
ncbi:histidinol-phosphatase HisJ family protein [Scatolibacter rhodanostii]|uniref:histidinol-phosphatase HisJ family protein n=1 Tax=Scatolibacter rhodanostii TaxID=2014781 RepID=UPI001FA8DA2D|nr:histidinol-phosphatase HisJ family protein [Scatolibacter rhodanostii]